MKSVTSHVVFLIFIIKATVYNTLASLCHLLQMDEIAVYDHFFNFQCRNNQLPKPYNSYVSYLPFFWSLFIYFSLILEEQKMEFTFRNAYDVLYEIFNSESFIITEEMRRSLKCCQAEWLVEMIYCMCDKVEIYIF